MKTNISLFFIFLLSSLHGLAFEPDTYCAHSVLASGKWVKVAVKESGMVRISRQELKSYGIDPAEAAVYGYGGARIPDLLSRENYVDDLPLVPCINDDKGLTFYAVGTRKYTLNADAVTTSINPYSDYGYYFIGTGKGKAIPVDGLADDGRVHEDKFIEIAVHELDRFSPAQSGHLMVGEDFRFNQTQSFKFTLPGHVGKEPKISVNFYSDASSTATLNMTANGKQLKSENNSIRPASAEDAYGSVCTITSSAAIPGEELNLTLNYKTSGSIKAANLDNIVINYTRRLAMTGNQLTFQSSESALQLEKASEGTKVWDVTDPQNVVEMRTTASGTTLKWINPYAGVRYYVAFNPAAALDKPKFIGTMANQDIHSMPTPDMVIISTPELMTYANQIAEIHHQSGDSLLIHVLNAENVYNEFSSGVADVAGFRKMLKMFYDRRDTTAHSLKYVMLMGRPTYDHRRVTSSGKASRVQTLPIWATEVGVNYSTSYSTDDFITFLEDNSGVNFSNDIMSISVGRIPVRSLSDASYYVNQLKKYILNPIQGQWRNQIMLIADDQDSGAHLDQTETMSANIDRADNNVFTNKIYLDAFKLIGGEYVQAKEKMMRLLQTGVIWWNYIGHGARQSLSHEHQLATTDLENLYIKRAPVFYGATCTFGIMEQDEPGGTELMVMRETGGCIASFCAVRPVYISQNGVLTANLGRELFRRDPVTGIYNTLGEITRRTKNATTSDSNKRRFALIGDPAMRLTIPSNRVVLDSIDNQAVTPDAQVTIPARAHAQFKGRVLTPTGKLIPDFNGTIDVSLYDAEFSTTSFGRETQGNPGKKATFEQQGARVFATADSVRNGHFTINVAMPEEISNNFRPAAFNMFAYDNSSRAAMGCNRDIFLYGVDENAPVDTVAPVIKQFYLNYPTFQTGDPVNESPMVMAEVTDNVAINLSTAGIGHEISLQLDKNTSFSDVSEYYTHTSTGGTIAYPLESLSEGNHTLRLRVWDTSGNSAQQTIDFLVLKGLKPTIFDAYSDANPASIQANFYIKHNRPDAMLDVKLEIYNMSGRREFTTTQRRRADMFLSSPISWDLRNSAGQRVPRGIYLYRVTLMDEQGNEQSSLTKRIAVAGE